MATPSGTVSTIRITSRKPSTDSTATSAGRRLLLGQQADAGDQRREHGRDDTEIEQRGSEEVAARGEQRAEAQQVDQRDRAPQPRRSDTRAACSGLRGGRAGVGQPCRTAAWAQRTEWSAAVPAGIRGYRAGVRHDLSCAGRLSDSITHASAPSSRGGGHLGLMRTPGQAFRSNPLRNLRFRAPAAAPANRSTRSPPGSAGSHRGSGRRRVCGTPQRVPRSARVCRSTGCGSRRCTGPSPRTSSRPTCRACPTLSCRLVARRSGNPRPQDGWPSR